MATEPKAKMAVLLAVVASYSSFFALRSRSPWQCSPGTRVLFPTVVSGPHPSGKAHATNQPQTAQHDGTWPDLGSLVLKERFSVTLRD